MSITSPLFSITLGPVLTRIDVERILVAAYHAGASDVFFQTGEFVRARVHGENHVVTARRLVANELPTVVDNQVRSTSGTIMSGRPADYADAVALDRVAVVNWRVNGTACAVGARDKGMEVVFRAIPGVPPLLSTQGLDSDLIRGMQAKDGMVLVVGPTGSGKSTVLASVMRDILENSRNRVIRSIEQPIEFTYDAVESHSSNIMAQSEVGTDVESFARGVTNCLRRAPTDILLGEMRDLETISAGILAAQTGHMVWTTGHAGSVAASINRIVNVFGGDDRRMRIVEFLQNLRVVLVQHLVKKIGGGRTPIREWLVITDAFRQTLLGCSPDQIQEVVRREVERLGQTLRHDLLEKQRIGAISAREVEPFLHGFSADTDSNVNAPTAIATRKPPETLVVASIDSARSAQSAHGLAVKNVAPANETTWLQEFSLATRGFIKRDKTTRSK